MSKREKDLRNRVLHFVETYLGDNGYAPTCDEIRRAIGLSSRSHAAYYLGALEEEGLIERTPYTPRGVRVLNPSWHLSPERNRREP